MKKVFLSTVFIVLNLFVLSQVTDSYWAKLESSAVNFSQVSDSFDIYINATYPDSIPQDKLGNIKNYFRYVNFWKSRIGLINGETSYEPYQDAILSLLTEPVCDEEDPANWELVGPVSNPNKQFLGLVSQVLYDPNNEGSYILSSDYGGLWKSQETGNSWRNVTDPLRIPGISASELIRSPINSSHLIASTMGGLLSINYGIGIIESFDNGNTWSVMQGFPYQSAPFVVKVLYDPYQSIGSEIALYAITQKKIYQSLNSGQSWVVIPGPPISSHDDYVDIETTASNTLLVSTKYRYNGHDGKIFRLTNGIWENIKDNNSFIADFQFASFSTPYNGKIFLHCADSIDAYVYKTIDAGDTWEYLGKKFRIPKNEIEYSPESNIVYSGRSTQLQFFKDDGTYHVYNIGVSSEMHVDIRDLEFMGIDANGYENILIATDGGITLCKLNFQDLVYELYNLNGNFLPICEFLGIGISHSSPEFIVGGTMHDNSYKYENGQWVKFGSGDGGDCEVNWLEPNIYYYSLNGYMVSSSSSIFSNFNREWFEGMEYELNPNNPYLLYYYHGKPSQNALLGIYNEETNQTSIKNLPVEIKKPGSIEVNSNNEIYVADFGANNDTMPNRLVKSIDDGNTWIDLSGNNVYETDGTLYGDLRQLLAWKTIEDIIFNPNNPNEIWISIGGVRMNDGTPENGRFRILHSTDGGNSWYDYSENLTAFPVMALEYQTGSNNRLFAGTDAGIYYRDPSMNQWECFSEGMPISIITDLDYNPCSKYLYASAYSRSIYKTYVPFDDNTQTIISNANEIWDSPIELANDLVIQNGSKLTITSDVYMAGGKKIIVEAGAKLIIDNGIITNRCNNLWQGIQVWGNKAAHQFPDANGNYQQGYVELLNGATIENAIIAVDLWEPENYESTGGIIRATDAFFRNNTKAIHALHYNNYIPVEPYLETDNNSNFKNCTFEITEDYMGTETFYKHIDLAYVKGIDFRGCDFLLDENAANISDYNHAIAGYDAKFRVSAVCNSTQNPCPEEDYDKCTFTGFWSAISAVNDGGIPLSFSVNRADFVNNAYGVRTTNMNNASVLFSNFEVGNYDGCGTGIYTDYVTGFAFEENQFTKYAQGPQANYFGISINNSKAVNDIYRNNFNGLSYANHSDGKNWDNSNYEFGLEYLCNTNTNNYADFYVADYIPGVSNSGIQQSQGSQELMAGNSFSLSNVTWHFYNGGEYKVDYYTDQTNTPLTPELRYQVNLEISNIENTCPSHYGGSGVLLSLSPQQKTDAEQVYYYSLNDFNNTKALYNSYIDGGNTESELLDIQTAQPSDMWALRAQLLGNSPHLSMEVLKEAADKTDVFPESALFDILAANPDELKKDTLISYLENKEEPLPDYMISLLQQLASGITYKTALQKQMADYKHTYTRAANDIIRSILNDTIMDYTELRNWLDNIGGITSDRQIISSYLSQGNFTDAFTIANMLPTLYELKGNDSIEHLYYMDMLNLYQTLNQQGRNTHQLDSTEKVDIVYIANNSTGLAGKQAKSILEAVYNDYCHTCPNVDGTNSYKTTSLVNPNLLGTYLGLDVNVKPNPAREWASFEYTLTVDVNTGEIEIRNVSGIVVDVLNLSANKGQILWDTRNFPAGLYVYTIKCSGYSKSGKLVISK